MSETPPSRHATVRRLAMFETPIAVAALENSEPMRLALETAILTRRQESEGIKRSNQGGWHSDTAMMTWGGAPATLLAKAAIGMAQRLTVFNGAAAADFEWRASMWANVSPPGAINHLHAHAGNDWAAVYYVATGASEGETSGALYFEDPRFPMNTMRTPALRLRDEKGKMQHSQVELQPKVGDLVVFPAWLRHGVRIHNGSGDRISIAINISVNMRQGRGGGDGTDQR